MARQIIFLNIGPPGFVHRLMVNILSLPGISSRACLWRNGIAITIEYRALLVQWTEEQKRLDVVIRSPPGGSPPGPLMEVILVLIHHLLREFRGAAYRDMIPFAQSSSFQQSTFTLADRADRLEDESTPLIPFRDIDKMSPAEYSIEEAIRRSISRGEEQAHIHISMKMIPITSLVPSPPIPHSGIDQLSSTTPNEYAY